MLGLASSGVCLAEPVTWPAGGLLHHRFTLAGPAGDLLSVALFRRVTSPGRYPAPRSVKFGLSSGRLKRHATAQPTLHSDDTIRPDWLSKGISPPFEAEPRCVDMPPSA